MNKILIYFVLFLFLISGAHALITKQQAEDAIVTAERDVMLMQNSGLSISYVNTTLDVAKRLLQGATVSMTIENAKSICAAYSTDTERKYCAVQLDYLQSLAQKGNVSLVEAKDENYAQIIDLTDKISERKREAFDARDKIRAVELKLIDYVKLDVDTSNAAELVNQSRQAMADERYDDALALVTKADQDLETKRAELTLGNAFLKGSKNFFIRNKDTLAGTLAVLILIAAVGQYPLRVYLLRRKVRKLRAQLKSLEMLMIGAQTDRFKTGKISESIYNIKMNVYKRKLDEARENLPLAEQNLKKISKFESTLKHGYDVVAEKSKPVVKLFKKSVHKIEEISSEIYRKIKKRRR